MKKLKRIYYPILVLLTLALAVLGVLTSVLPMGGDELSASSRAKINENITELSETVHSSADAGSDVYVSSLRSILRKLDADGDYVAYDGGLSVHDEDGYNTGVDYYVGSSLAANKPFPTILRTKSIVTEKTLEDTTVDNTYYVGYEFYQLAFAIPGKDTVAAYADTESTEPVYGDAVLITTHFDTSTLSSEANVATVANMLEVAYTTAYDYMNGNLDYKNDIVFLFTFGNEEINLGALTFMRQCTCLKNIAARVKTVVNFDALGSSGKLTVTDAVGSAAIGAFSAFGGTGSSIFASLFAPLQNTTVIENTGLAGIDFTVVPDSTTGTTDATVSDKMSVAIGSMIARTVKYFGNANVSSFTTDGSGAYFNYLGGSAYYTNIAAYVIAAILIVMLCFLVFFSIKKKYVKLDKAIKGVGVQLLTAVSTMAAAFVAFIVFALIACGFEVINFYAIFTVTSANIPMILLASVMSLALSVPFYTFYKKIFDVKGTPVIQGNALIFAVVAIITLFALPSVSYVFAIPALLWLAIMILMSVAKKSLADKLGFNPDRLLLYAIPSLLILPVVLGETVLAFSVLPMAYLPVMMGLMVMFCGGIMPYADRLVRPISELVARLPKRKIKIKRTVVETVEDPVKKGKFTEVETTKTIVEEVERTYTNSFGVFVVSFVCSIAIVIISAFGGGFGSGISSNYTFSDELYKDAIVYVNDNGATRLEVRDLDAFKYVNRCIEGFSWDAQKGAYVKSDENSLGMNLAISADSDNSKLFTVTANETAHSSITVFLDGFSAGSIDKVTFRLGEQEIVYSLSDDATEAKFVLPHGEDSGFTFEIEGSASYVNVSLEQRYFGNANIAQEHTVWKALQTEYSNDKSVNLRFSIIVKTDRTFSL